MQAIRNNTPVVCASTQCRQNNNQVSFSARSFEYKELGAKCICNCSDWFINEVGKKFLNLPDKIFPKALKKYINEFKDALAKEHNISEYSNAPGFLTDLKRYIEVAAMLREDSVKVVRNALKESKKGIDLGEQFYDKPQGKYSCFKESIWQDNLANDIKLKRAQELGKNKELDPPKFRYNLFEEPEKK